MMYDYTKIADLTLALNNVLADNEETHRETIDLSNQFQILEWVDDETQEPREFPEKLAEELRVLPNPVYLNYEGYKLMQKWSGEASRILQANRAAIIGMCQERADRGLPATPEILELSETLRKVCAAITADQWNHSWGITLERECGELAAAIESRIPLERGQETPDFAALSGGMGNDAIKGGEAPQRGGNAPKTIGKITIDRERLKRYFNNYFKGMNQASIDHYKSFCDTLERDAVEYCLADLARVAYWIARSEYRNPNFVVESFPKWLTAFFEICGCEPPKDKAVCRYRGKKERVSGVLNYLGKPLEEPAKWRKQ